MSDTNVKLIATIDATSKGLVDALNKAQSAVNGTTSNWQKKFETINKATNKIGEHVQKLSEIIAKAGDGALDTSAIQAEINALEEAKNELNQTTTAFDKLDKSAKEAGKSISETAAQTANAGNAFDGVASKIKVAGISMKDLKDAFSDGAQSAAAMANIYAAAISAIISGINSYSEELKKVEAHEKKMAELRNQERNQSENFLIDDTQKASEKMKELLSLRENWKGTEEEKTKEKILVREIDLLQQQLREGDRVKVAINGQVVEQYKLVDAIQKTIAAERELKLLQLRKNIGSDQMQFEKALGKYNQAELATKGVSSEAYNVLKRLSSGDFSDLSWDSVDADALRSANDELAELYIKIQKEVREYTKLNNDTSSPADVYRLWQARISDKAMAQVQTDVDKRKQQAQAESQAKTAVYEGGLNATERAKAESIRKANEEYEQNKKSGVSEETATELKNLRIAEAEKQYADAIQKAKDEEAKKQKDLQDAMQQRIDGYKKAYTQYLQAEAEVERAQKAYANAQRDLAREAQAEATRKRRNEIKERLATFGFSIATGFNPYESASERNERKSNLKTDASISAKMQDWQAGKQVHFTPAEKRRLEEYQGLQSEDKALEASQKQMDAAKQTENAATRLASAADAVKKAFSNLSESKTNATTAKAGVASDAVSKQKLLKLARLKRL